MTARELLALLLGLTDRELDRAVLIDCRSVAPVDIENPSMGLDSVVVSERGSFTLVPLSSTRMMTRSLLARDG